MSAPLIRPRTVPEILDAAFGLLRQHYVPIVSATAIILFPAILLQALLPEDVAPLAALLQNFLLNFAAAATVVLVADVYLGREPDVGAALGQVGRRSWAIFAAAFFQGVLLIVGLLLCIVPGIIAYALLFAGPIVVMVEGLGPIKALERSVELADEHLLRILGSAVLALLVVLVAALGLGMLVGLAFPEGRQAAVIASVLALFIQPFPVVVSTLLYFDIRIRKEAFGMDDLASAFGDAPPQPEGPRPGW